MVIFHTFYFTYGTVAYELRTIHILVLDHDAILSSNQQFLQIQSNN